MVRRILFVAPAMSYRVGARPSSGSITRGDVFDPDDPPPPQAESVSAPTRRAQSNICIGLARSTRDRATFIRPVGSISRPLAKGKRHLISTHHYSGISMEGNMSTGIVRIDVMPRTAMRRTSTTNV